MGIVSGGFSTIEATASASDDFFMKKSFAAIAPKSSPPMRRAHVRRAGPSGRIIEPWRAASEPGMRYELSKEVSTCATEPRRHDDTAAFRVELPEHGAGEFIADCIFEST